MERNTYYLQSLLSEKNNKIDVRFGTSNIFGEEKSTSRRVFSAENISNSPETGANYLKI